MKDRIRINGMLYESVGPDSIIDDVLRGDPNWVADSTDVGDSYSLRSSSDVEAFIYKPESGDGPLDFIAYLNDVSDDVVDSVIHNIVSSCRNVDFSAAGNSMIEGSIDSRYVTKSSVRGLANAIASLVKLNDSVYDNMLEVGESSSVRRYKSKTDFIMIGYRGSNESWIRAMSYGPFTVIDHDLTFSKSYNGEVAVIVDGVGYIGGELKDDYKKIVSDLRKFIPRAKYPATSEELLKQFYRKCLSGRGFEKVKETSKGSADFKILNKYYKYV